MPWPQQINVLYVYIISSLKLSRHSDVVITVTGDRDAIHGAALQQETNPCVASAIIAQGSVYRVFCAHSNVIEETGQ